MGQVGGAHHSGKQAAGWGVANQCFWQANLASARPLGSLESLHPGTTRSVGESEGRGATADNLTEAPGYRTKEERRSSRLGELKVELRRKSEDHETRVRMHFCLPYGVGSGTVVIGDTGPGREPQVLDGYRAAEDIPPPPRLPTGQSGASSRTRLHLRSLSS